MMSQIPLQFDQAIVRTPAESVVGGLRAVDRGDPTFIDVKTEHDAYVQALRSAAVDVSVLPALEEFPDSIFVEDPALVFSKGAILLRPGAETRRDETKHLRPALKEKFDCVLDLPEPGFADGGDILSTPSKVLIGLSTRTNRAGAVGLQACLQQLGIRSEVVSTPADVLHFKSDCSILDETTILATERLARSGAFAGLGEGFEVIEVPEGEEASANALRVNKVVLVSSHFPRTISLLTDRGYEVVALPTRAIERIDAGLSCMSLRW